GARGGRPGRRSCSFADPAAGRSPAAGRPPGGVRVPALRVPDAGDRARGAREAALADSAAMKPLLCVRHEPEDDGGLALETFASAGLQVETADAWNGTAFPDVDAISGLVVFGGTMNVDQVDRYPFLGSERDLVGRALVAHLPVLGVCLGAQMLARALGEPVEPGPVRTLGFTPVHPTEAGRADPLASVFEDGAMTFHWHEDVFALPAGCEQLASGEDGSVQMFRRHDRTWGI